MPAGNMAGGSGLKGDLLRSVSRSFYLSVRLLPGRLREPVGLGYLLARATDTLADSMEVPALLRREKLAVLARVIQEGDGLNQIPDLQQAFAPLQKDDAERTLILSLSECLQRLHQLEAFDQLEIRTVLHKITQAQALDLARFSEPTQIQALKSAAELEEYAYLIAGCVGEFWTELCFHHLRNFAERPRAEMRALGKSYGVGLQLVNIVRDAYADLRAGRCYFPKDELSAVGLEPADILHRPAVFKPIMDKWLGDAENGLRAGMQYVEAIRDRRVRMATVLPALIGARTIARLRAVGTQALTQKVKIRRQEVRGMLASVAFTLGARPVLSGMFQRGLKVR